MVNTIICRVLSTVFTARCYADRARHCYGKVVCLSVCLSVTLRCRDHTGWTPSKIISRLVSLGCSLIRKCKNPLGKNVSRYKSASLTVQGESWQENSSLIDMDCMVNHTVSATAQMRSSGKTHGPSTLQQVRDG